MSRCGECGGAQAGTEHVCLIAPGTVNERIERVANKMARLAEGLEGAGLAAERRRYALIRDLMINEGLGFQGELDLENHAQLYAGYVAGMLGKSRAATLSVHDGQAFVEELVEIAKTILTRRIP